MAYTTIDDPTIFFNTVLYTGTGSSNSVTGVGFQPDWVWLKKRNSTGNHFIYDAVRGVQKTIYTDATSAEATQSQGLTAFGADGFTVGTNTNINGSSNTNVSWNWKAGGSASSNSDGSITSSVSANTTAGLSIVSYTGNGTAGATVGHGLGAVPQMYWVKSRSLGDGWRIYHDKVSSNPETDYLVLNNTNAVADYDGYWNDTAPTSSVFSLGSAGEVNSNGSTNIAYCFTGKQGYSKFGSYTGNGNADGPFVYTGFKPAFVLLKNANGTLNWNIQDNKRDTFNPVDRHLAPNKNAAEIESSNYNVDFLSNGFKIRNSLTVWNASGNTLIYMAFAESPFVNSNSIPNNAR